ncbi:hypothetical protein [Brevibacillus sp. 1238]|uniref:hypothetical protein n=1 Tax=Brevibacillus sp. 1238 TaxID=2940565 RepID=UPI0024761F45|nr:hypothetical protein [Brevibacillus sp. 1238]MDH6351891.1 putative transcriptional regulator [Brevibacillus sp. 1238]
MGIAEQGAAGFFVLPRSSWRSKRDKLLYYDLVEQANYRDTAGCKRGQLITSTLQLSKDTGWTEKQVRGSLEYLKQQALITIETFKDRKKGMIVTITAYEKLQDLSTYRNQKLVFNSFQKGELNGELKGECEGELEVPENAVVPKVEGTSKEGEGELKDELKGEFEGDSLTAVLTTDKQQKDLKDLPEQLAHIEHVESFVDSQMLANPISNLPRKLFVKYFNTIRLKRATGRIAVGKAAKIWDKLLTYWQNKKLADTPEGRAAIILYALSLHVLQHDDKAEEYTFGIIRRTTEHEARQKMLKIRNQGGAGREVAATGTDGRAEYHQKRRSF